MISEIFDSWWFQRYLIADDFRDIFFFLPSFSPSHCSASPYLRWLPQLLLLPLLSFSSFLSWSASNRCWLLHWLHHWLYHWLHHWLYHWLYHWLHHWSHHWCWRRQPRRERLLLLQASSAFSSQLLPRPPVQIVLYALHVAEQCRKFIMKMVMICGDEIRVIITMRWNYQPVQQWPPQWPSWLGTW